MSKLTASARRSRIGVAREKPLRARAHRKATRMANDGGFYSEEVRLA